MVKTSVTRRNMSKRKYTQTKPEKVAHLYFLIEVQKLSINRSAVISGLGRTNAQNIMKARREALRIHQAETMQREQENLACPQRTNESPAQISASRPIPACSALGDVANGLSHPQTVINEVEEEQAENQAEYLTEPIENQTPGNSGQQIGWFFVNEFYPYADPCIYVFIQPRTRRLEL